MQYPVFTFSSGPTNSMRGAAFLSDLPDAIVIDIGGTTTDIGVLKNGFPREASSQRTVTWDNSCICMCMPIRTKMAVKYCILCAFTCTLMYRLVGYGLISPYPISIVWS